ncbi:unnamed protein product [Sphenostylis stenocarpa]|uniref:Uncharacterized protein n=1 Tax=Sphenostylis stenocarpa TaxID=92480 RepID=A0AA86S4L3_9FABA|nr:unnamed protein product [Sphenostylis stenocarpa]
MPGKSSPEVMGRRSLAPPEPPPPLDTGPEESLRWPPSQRPPWWPWAPPLSEGWEENERWIDKLREKTEYSVPLRTRAEKSVTHLPSTLRPKGNYHVRRIGPTWQRWCQIRQQVKHHVSKMEQTSCLTHVLRMRLKRLRCLTCSHAYAIQSGETEIAHASSSSTSTYSIVFSLTLVEVGSTMRLDALRMRLNKLLKCMDSIPSAIRFLATSLKVHAVGFFFKGKSLKGSCDTKGRPLRCA